RNRVCGGQQHGVGDVRDACVQQPAEEAREGQDVVDLVGEVAATGGNHGGMLPGNQRIHLGIRVCHGEDDCVLVHGRNVVLVQDVRGRDADEHIGSGDGFLQGAGEI